MLTDVCDRSTLVPLFKGCQYDRIIMDSVLEGYCGTAHADSATEPTVARLDCGYFTILGGSPDAAAALDLLRLAPVGFVTPQNDGWRRLLRDEFDTRITVLPFVSFSPASLEPGHLAELVRSLPPAFELRRVDRPLAGRLAEDTGNESFLETFLSVDDFLERGLGCCILHEGRIVSAATSIARSSKAIDIEIETVAAFRNRGLATVVGASLALLALEHELEPHWLAANATSERLALRLGYTRTGGYETFEVSDEHG